MAFSMKSIGSILTKVGGSVLKDLIPGGNTVATILDVVGAAAGVVLPKNATGTQVQDVIDGLPAEKQAEITAMRLEVEIVEAQEWTKVVGHLSKADESGKSTRPWIAIITAINMLVVTDALVVMIMVAIWPADISKPDDRVKMVKEMLNLWPLILALILPWIELVRAYFGMRSKDKNTRAQVAMGKAPPAPGLIGSIASLFGKG